MCFAGTFSGQLSQTNMYLHLFTDVVSSYGAAWWLGLKTCCRSLVPLCPGDLLVNTHGATLTIEKNNQTSQRSPSIHPSSKPAVSLLGL